MGLEQLMEIKKCPECGNDSGDVEFEDRIRHFAFVECLTCRHRSDSIEGQTKEEAVEKAIALWNKESEE